MKNVLIIVIFALSIGQMAQAQTLKRLSTETVGYWTLGADTLQITRLDKVVKGSIYVPSFSTDSVVVSGCTFIIDGTVTNGITIPPGEASFNFGFDYAFSDSVRIESRDVTWLQLLIKRD